MPPKKSQVYNDEEMEEIKRSLNFMSEEISKMSKQQTKLLALMEEVCGLFLEKDRRICLLERRVEELEQCTRTDDIVLSDPTTIHRSYARTTDGAGTQDPEENTPAEVHSLEQQRHTSILADGETLTGEICEGETYKCPLCTYKAARYMVENHIRGHSFVKHADFKIMRCGLQCRDATHFHCCYCTATIIRRCQLLKHLDSHQKILSTPQHPRSSLWQKNHSNQLPSNSNLQLSFSLCPTHIHLQPLPINQWLIFRTLWLALSFQRSTLSTFQITRNSLFSNKSTQHQLHSLWESLKAPQCYPQLNKNPKLKDHPFNKRKPERLLPVSIAN